MTFRSDGFVLTLHVEVRDFGAEKEWSLCHSDLSKVEFSLKRILFVQRPQ